MHLDVKLTLGRYLVEASSAGVTLYVYYAKSVAHALPYALEARQQARLYLGLVLLSLLLELLLLLARFLHNLVKLALLLLQSHLAVSNQFLSLLQVGISLLNLDERILDFLLAQLYLKRLELYFLGKGVILAVVLHLVELSLIPVHAGLGSKDVATLLRYGLLELGDFILNLLHAGVQADNLVFQVLHLKRQLTPKSSFLVDCRQCCLKMIEGAQLIFL